MSRDALAGDWAKFRLRRNDFPYPQNARLLRQTAQQGHRHVSLNVVLAHVPGVATVILQELHHVRDVGAQLDGNGHRPALADGCPFCTFALGCAAPFIVVDQSAEMGAEVGIRELLLGWRRRDVIVAVGGSARNGGNHEDHQSGQDQHYKRT